jgi:hypothetical protein
VTSHRRAGKWVPDRRPLDEVHSLPGGQRRARRLRSATNHRASKRTSNPSSAPPHLDQWSHRDVKTFARSILETVRTGSMPGDVRWSSEQVAVLECRLRHGMEVLALPARQTRLR